MRTSEPSTKNFNMFVAVLFIPLVAGNVFLESEFHRLPKITERSSLPKKTFLMFDPCNTKKPGNRNVSCSQLQMMGNDETREYFIKPHNEMYVWCDMKTKGGGWTVIQRRGEYEHEDTRFETSERDYDNGFLGSGSSYWIGNENLHRLTTFPSNKQVLKIELTREHGENITVEYGTFKVGSKDEKYKLTISDYKGDPSYDALTSYNGEIFFVVDSGYNDPDPNCYPPRSGGWWYSRCVRSNLNGRRFKHTDTKNEKGLGITWSKLGDKKSYDAVYKKVEMKIRDANFDFCMGNMATYSDI